MKTLSPHQREQAFRLYIILGALFIASLVACNLIFQKFFYWQPLPQFDFTFKISVGILPYPITFLITDLISELFGRKRSNQVVIAGLMASVFVFIIVWLAEMVPAVDFSPVDDDVFSAVFGKTGVAVLSSMVAYLIAQFVDIRVFHFWKRLTKGRHLWLRNNFSTIFSQWIDTAVVLGLLCFLGSLNWKDFGDLLLNGFIFKVLMALLDTPIFYFTTYLARQKFGLKMGEEISL